MAQSRRDRVWPIEDRPLAATKHGKADIAQLTDWASDQTQADSSAKWYIGAILSVGAAHEPAAPAHLAPAAMIAAVLVIMLLDSNLRAKCVEAPIEISSLTPVQAIAAILSLQTLQAVELSAQLVRLSARK